MPPLFTVVIPTRNRSQLVGLAIKSVFRQTFGNYEVVVVDNDTTDATRKVVSGFHASKTIPEPATLGTLVLGGLILLRRPK